MGRLESNTDIVVLLDDETTLKFSRDQKVLLLTEAGAYTLKGRVAASLCKLEIGALEYFDFVIRAFSTRLLFHFIFRADARLT
jgi:hypothetical protein